MTHFEGCVGDRIAVVLPVTASLTDVDPRGPIANLSQKSPVVSTGRVEVRDFRFDPQSIPPMPGKANWIWLKGSVWETTHPVAAQFRKEFALPSKPVSAKVWFSSDAHARIYVNGHLAARGPDDGGQDYPGTQTGKWFVNYSELAPFFHKGKNVLAAEVFNSDVMLGRYNTTGHGGLLLEASLQFSSGAGKIIEADASWKGREAKEWKFADWMEGQTPRRRHSSLMERRNWWDGDLRGSMIPYGQIVQSRKLSGRRSSKVKYLLGWKRPIRGTKCCV